MEILQKVIELKAELDTYRPLDKDQEAAIMQKLRLDWNFHSNHLEGNTLSFGETKALILFGITAAGKPLKDHFEITGHDEAIKWVEEVVKEDRPLTESFIRELHKLILKEPYEMPTVTPEGIPAKRIIQVGVYKTVPNHVLTPTGEIFRFATPEETPAMMSDLINWFREKESDPESHPLLIAAEFHYKYIRIHPFDDGNGRTARILMNFILMKYGYPPVIIKTEDKANYIAALQQSDAGIIVPFIEYIGKNLEQSLDLMIRGAKGESIDDADDVDKEIALIEQKVSSLGKVLKSKNTIISVFENSIINLFKKYIHDALKFQKLYENVFTTCVINTENDENPPYILETMVHKNRFYELPSIAARLKGETITPELSKETLIDLIDFFKMKIKEYESIKILRVVFTYNSFNKPGFEKFDYKSMLRIDFEKKEYVVRGSNDKKLMNFPYSFKLSDKDINSVIRLETKAHTDYIHQQIEKAKSQ